MPSTRLVLIALLLILLPYAAATQIPTGGSSETARRLFEEMALEGRLKEPVREMHLQLIHNPFGLPPDRNERLTALFEQAFAKDSLLADAQMAFHRQYNASLGDAALQQITGDTLRQVLDSEQQFYTLQGLRERVVRRYELEQNPPPENRINLVQSVAEHKESVASRLETEVEIYRAIVSALGELSGRQSFTETQIDGIVSGYRNQIQPHVEQQVTSQMLLMYHGLDEGVLNRYRAFYASETGNWLGKATSGSIHAAYREATSRFLQSVRNL